MAKLFYYWQTVSKRPHVADLAFLKAIWPPWFKPFLLGVRFDHDVTVSQDGCHDSRAEDGVNEDHDGDPTHGVEGRKKEKRIFRVKPDNQSKKDKTVNLAESLLPNFFSL